MPFDRVFLDELSARNDIVDIVSQYVQLKKSGANYSVFALSTMKRPLRFLFLGQNRFSTASAVRAGGGDHVRDESRGAGIP